MIRRGDEGGALSEISPLTMFYQPEPIKHGAQRQPGQRVARGFRARGRADLTYIVGKGFGGRGFWMVTRRADSRLSLRRRGRARETDPTLNGATTDAGADSSRARIRTSRRRTPETP